MAWNYSMVKMIIKPLLKKQMFSASRTDDDSIETEYCRGKCTGERGVSRF